MNNTRYTLGLLSGTSMDHIDVVLAKHHDGHTLCVDGMHHIIPNALQKQLKTLCQPGFDEINRMGQCDTELGHVFANAALSMMQQHPQCPISAIGCHGQTIRHHPEKSHGFTCQIGNPHTIAERTGITTIADFRRRDLSVGGQGAPLAPLFHQHVFWQNDQRIAVLNIGGMANVSLLDGHSPTHTLGFDTGPGNCLMDAWIKQHHQQPYDDQGKWAMQGHVLKPLLTACLNHPYFAKAPPKSTGHEMFHLAWLNQLMPPHARPVDVQRSLMELTAQSICHGITQGIRHAFQQPLKQLVVCGGGAHNTALMARLQSLMPCPVTSTASVGIAPQWVEGTLFAWLADQYQQGTRFALQHITGSRKAVQLGVAYEA